MLDAKGQPLVCSVDITMNQVFFQAWRVNVGRIPVYLLDTNRPENAQHFRDLTLRVYGGDSTTRIMQEMLLGIGGVRLLRALGIAAVGFSHERGPRGVSDAGIDARKNGRGQNRRGSAGARRAQQCIFTTHTPVEAGHDRFNAELMDYALHKYAAQFKMPFADLLALGRVNPKNAAEPFCMTVLALKASRAANGVSELHGQVSRHMWQSLYPGMPVDQVPIGHITNGIHLLGWMKGPVRRFWRRKLTRPKCGREAEAASGDTTRFWRAIRTRAGTSSSIRRNSGRRWRTRSSFRTRKSGRCATSCAGN